MTLFRDFLRHFPRARVEDYYKDGKWLMEQLEVDLALVAQHRREAGAPDPEPLEDIPAPELPQTWRPAPPKQPPSVPMRGSGPPNGRRDRAPIGTSRNAGPRQPSMPPSAAAVAAQRGPGLQTLVASAAPDARAVADFIAKWRLESSRSKLLLARLAPNRRRDIMDNFRHQHKELSATSSLEKYIATRFPPPAAKPPGAPSATSAPRDGGTKRPMSSSPPSKEPPSKRPREGPIGAAAPPSTASGSAANRSIRSPPPGRGGSRAAPPPWRDSRDTSAPPPSSRRPPPPSKGPAPAPGRKPPAGGAPRPTPAPSRSSSALGASGAADDAKPGDLIKNLLG